MQVDDMLAGPICLVDSSSNISQLSRKAYLYDINTYFREKYGTVSKKH